MHKKPIYGRISHAKIVSETQPKECWNVFFSEYVTVKIDVIHIPDVKLKKEQQPPWGGFYFCFSKYVGFLYLSWER